MWRTTVRYGLLAVWTLGLLVPVVQAAADKAEKPKPAATAEKAQPAATTVKAKETAKPAEKTKDAKPAAKATDAKPAEKAASAEEKCDLKAAQDKVAPKLEKKEKKQAADDSRYEPTHEAMCEFSPFSPKEGGRMVHSFCMDRWGNLLTCCTGRSPVGKDGAAPGEIRVLSTESGEVEATIALEFTPQAICETPNGNAIFVGGDGFIAKLSRDEQGMLKVVKKIETPSVTAFQKKFAERQAKIKKAAEKAKVEAAKKAAAAKDGKGDEKSSSSALFSAIRKAVAPAPKREDSDSDSEENAVRTASYRFRPVTAVTATDRDVFISVPNEKSGYSVYRFNHNLEEPKQVIERLYGCCGQMDILAKGDEIWVAHNGQSKVDCFNRDGKQLKSWGKRDARGIKGFGGCCNPKNLLFNAKGNAIYTSDSGPPEVVKLNSLDGELLQVIAIPKFKMGCVRMTMAADKDGSRLFVLNGTSGKIHVLIDKRYSPEYKPLRTIALTKNTDKPLGDEGFAAKMFPEKTKTFCLDQDGNLLVGYGGIRTTIKAVDPKVGAPKGAEVFVIATPKPTQYYQDMEKEPAAVLVLTPEGKETARRPIDITPNALCVAPDGEIYAAGDGRIVRLSRDGRVLKTADLPSVAAFVEGAAAKQAKAAEKVAEKAAKKAEKKADAKTQVETPEEVLKAARKMAGVSSITATEKEVFVACRSTTGTSVYRMGRDFAAPVKIVQSLPGCCGQMDLQADGKGGFRAAVNGEKRVARYDREGKRLSAWGGDERQKGFEGFGGCCNPMNIRCLPDGSIITSDSGSGRLRHFSSDGKFLCCLALVEGQSGCKHVPIAMSKDRSRLYSYDIGRQAIVVLAKRDRKAEKAVEEAAEKAEKERKERRQKSLKDAIKLFTFEKASAKVLLDGAPIKAAHLSIQLQPEKAAKTPANVRLSFHGYRDGDACRFTTAVLIDDMGEGREGVPPGKYKVTIYAFNEDGEVLSKLVPSKYQNPNSTPLSIEVQAKGKNEFTLELKSK